MNPSLAPDKDALRRVLWDLWTAGSSSQNPADLTEHDRILALRLARQILASADVEFEHRSPHENLELLSWAVFGTDSLPRLPSALQSDALDAAAVKYGISSEQARWLATRAHALLR